MSGYTRQVQTKLREATFYMFEELAHSRGVTVSELLRDLVERELGQPLRIPPSQQLIIELVLEVCTLVAQCFAARPGTDLALHRIVVEVAPERARAEAVRRIREAADRERTK